MIQLLLAITAGEYADAQHAGPTGCHMVPDRVADGDAIGRCGAELAACSEKEVRLRLAMQLSLPFPDDYLRTNANVVKGSVHQRPVARRGDGMRDPRTPESAEHLDSARQGPRARHDLPE